MLKRIAAALLSAGTLLGSALCVNAAEADTNGAANMAIKLGDADGDGTINAVDASIILSNYARYATSTDKPTEYELATQDVNSDSLVNAVDASIVLSYYAYTSIGGKLGFADYVKDPNADPKVPATTTTNVVTTTASTTTTSITTTPTESAKLSGELITIANDKKDMPSIRGISFAGNVAGSTAFNSKAPSLSGIRCIFELDEWISPSVDTDTKTGITMYILKHRDDQKSYETAEYSEEMQGYAGTFSLDYDDDSNNWGEFYMHPEEAEAGYYDFIFTYKGTAFAKLYTRFYNTEELKGRSDDELQKLMIE